MQSGSEGAYRKINIIECKVWGGNKNKKKCDVCVKVTGDTKEGGTMIGQVRLV